MSAIDEAVDACGGRRQLAEACGVRYQAVQKWQQSGRVPAERVLQIEEVSGVSRCRLRPDLYPADDDADGERIAS